MAKRKGPAKKDPATEDFEAGYKLVEAHALFGGLLGGAYVLRRKGNYCPPEAWAVTVDSGEIHVNPTRRGAPAEWAHVIAHGLLHLALEHFNARPRIVEWNVACCATVERMLAGMKFGRVPEEMLCPSLPPQPEATLYEELCSRGVPEELASIGTAGAHRADLWFMQGRAAGWKRSDWKDRFRTALQNAVDRTIVSVAGEDYERSGDHTPARRARRWFIDHYPLLGSLAMMFEIVEDPRVLYEKQISIAAVDPEAKTIWMNSERLTEEEARFVMAHELLHVGLRHGARCQGRDPFVWNVACDYVINDWLIEMGIGELPKIGALHDRSLRGQSAEGIYDRIVQDLRATRKLATLRGQGLGDLMERTPDWWAHGEGVTLDELYRRCLVQGLSWHEDAGRGLLPAGIVDEIRALAQPPIPWDVELARWFDRFFSPLEKRRTYARASRRQSATPDIPRPAWVLAPGALDARTFGVVLDTSGSMWMQQGSNANAPSEKHVLLKKALGSIATYAISRDVPAVRLIFCDADAYDQGYVPPEEILDRRVRVKGKGGTVLQPGIDLLERATDFPPDAPILIITDGECDRLSLRREHAFLMPQGRTLPFTPKGDVFRIGN